MFRVFLLSAVGIVCMVSGTALAQQDEVPFCDAKDFVFTCSGKIENNADVLEAMASDRTHVLLSENFASSDKFPIGDKRETFRLDLEKRRKQMTTFADQSFAQYRRKKISEEDYAKLREKYQRAVENYRIALNIYRKGTWLSGEKQRHEN